MPNNLESCNAPNFIIKDFVTRTGSHYGFFNNNGIISIAAQCTVFEFLIDAPENYGISNEKYRTTILWTELTVIVNYQKMAIKSAAILSVIPAHF